MVEYAACPNGFVLAGYPYKCFNLNNSTAAAATFVCPNYVNAYNIVWWIAVVFAACFVAEAWWKGTPNHN